MIDMETTKKIPTRIAVTWHSAIEGADNLAALITANLKARDIDSVQSYTLNDDNFQRNLSEKRYDMVIAIGGDGTMLRIGKRCAPMEIPVMGINMGHFGFLIETKRDAWKSRLDDIFALRWEVDRRMMIHAEHYSGKALRGSWDVLNEITIARGLSMRPVHLTVQINDIELAEYAADGLILATATGSTAYNQAVNGPILRPDMRNMLLTPIAPYLCIDRCLVLPETDTVHFTVSSYVETIISPDGYQGVSLELGDQIIARAADHSALFVRFGDQGSFYRKITGLMQRNPTVLKTK